jgi:hypothetical protein
MRGIRTKTEANSFLARTDHRNGVDLNRQLTESDTGIPILSGIVKKRAGEFTGSSSLSYSQAVGAAPLKEREPSQATMPLLANLLLD